MEKQLTLEQKKQKVKDFRPIDDVFFEVLADDILFCQEILRTILEDNKLIVNDVIVQSSERNLYGRSVRLDALCTLGNGEKCNIEVQRSDNDDHLKRVRFNASSITVKESQVNDKFQDVAGVYVVYISEFDIFGKGRTIYHVENVIQETGDQVDDGLHRIFVNTACDDGTDIADLMSCFKEKQVNNPKFPVFTSRMNKLKNEEGGLNIMCEVMLKYEKIAAEDAAKKERIEAIQNMIDLGLSEDKILTKYSKEEYEKAKQVKWELLGFTVTCRDSN